MYIRLRHTVTAGDISQSAEPLVGSVKDIERSMPESLPLQCFEVQRVSGTPYHFRTGVIVDNPRQCDDRAPKDVLI
jgi:hypothetical protein